VAHQQARVSPFVYRIVGEPARKQPRNTNNCERVIGNFEEFVSLFSFVTADRLRPDNLLGLRTADDAFQKPKPSYAQTVVCYADA